MLIPFLIHRPCSYAAIVNRKMKDTVKTVLFSNMGHLCIIRQYPRFLVNMGQQPCLINNLHFESKSFIKVH